MRKHLSLFLAASFLCLSQNIKASSRDHDIATSTTSAQNSTRGETPAVTAEPSTEERLKQRLIRDIGEQTGDLDLFLRNHLETFQALNAKQLVDELVSDYYKDTLSPDTEHGKFYRSIGTASLNDSSMGKNLFLPKNALRLVPLNFPGIEKIEGLTLDDNELRIPPILTHLKSLTILFLSENQLKYPPVLRGLNHLQVLLLNDNQLEEAPDLTGLVRLTDVALKNNNLTTMPKLPLAPIPINLTISGNPVSYTATIQSFVHQNALVALDH